MRYALESFTGIRPTADLTVANYIGAIQPILDDEATGVTTAVFLAELHAGTTTDPRKVGKYSTELTRTLIASDVKGEIYSQYDVKDLVAQTEYAIRGLTTAARLLRLPTLKDQVVQSDNVETANAALVMYPLMMASDIILARPHTVPTGKDQKPHLEITNELIRATNRTYGTELPIPAQRETESINLLSLDNSGRKMSKSLPGGAVFLDDPADIARRKIMKAPTASEPGEQMDRAIDNLTMIAEGLNPDKDAFLSIQSLAQLVKDGSRVTKQFKTEVADTVTDFLAELADKRDNVSDEDVADRRAAGHEWFRPIATETLHHIDEHQR